MSGLEICFTGFAKQSRSDLEELATDSGFVVRKAVTRNLHILCAGCNAGPKKVADAKADGAAILLENDFVALVKNGELSEENAEKLSTLLNRREDLLREHQFNQFQANFSENFLKDELSKLKKIKCTNHSQFTESLDTIKLSDVFVCFTGDFISSNDRNVLHAITAYRGAFIDTNVTLKTKYLVIGSLGSELWTHTDYGSKIEKALLLKENGHEIYVISEEQWLTTI